MCPELADQVLQLIDLVFPFLSFRQWSFALSDAFPGGQLGQLSVEFGHVLLVFGYIFFCVNRVDRALRDAYRAVDALIRVDGQKVRAFAKAIHGANIDAIGVLALDAGFGDGMGHF